MAKVNGSKEELRIYYETLSLNLKYYRKLTHKTQAEMAALAGISEKYLSLIESPSACQAPSLKVLFRLANLLMIEPYQLFVPFDNSQISEA